MKRVIIEISSTKQEREKVDMISFVNLGGWSIKERKMLKSTLAMLCGSFILSPLIAVSSTKICICLCLWCVLQLSVLELVH